MNEEEIVDVTLDNIDLLADLIQVDTLNDTCSFQDLYDTYNIDRKGLMKIIAELRKRGNNIQILSAKNLDSKNEIELNDEKFIKNFGHKQLYNDESYRIENNDDNIKLMFASDLRFGSIYEQPSIFNEMCSTAKACGVKYIVINGDLFEGIFKGTKEILNQTLFKHGYEEQSDYAALMLPRIDGIKYLLITGEHDLSFLNSKAQVDIGKILASKRDDVTYLGPKKSKIVFTNGDNSNEISIDLRHHVGTVPYTISYRPQQIIQSYRNEDKPDILVCSHFLACDSFLRRGVRELQVPSVCATTDEMNMQNTPVYNSVASWILTINKDKKGKLESTSQFLLPYYTTLKNDYKTAKPLIISDTYSVPIKKRTQKDLIDKMFAVIKNGETLSHACTKLEIDELEFMGLLEEFRIRDYDIEVVEKTAFNDETNEFYDVKVINKKSNTKRQKNIKSPLEDLEHLKLVFFSDTHCCSEYEQKSFMEEVIKEGYERGYKEFIHFGDVDDGEYLNRKDHRYGLHKKGFTEHAEYIVDQYFPIAEKNDIHYTFITATHDGTHMQNGGADLGKFIDRFRDDMTYIGSDQAIHLIGKDQKTKLGVRHPGGGCASALSYKLQKYIDKIEPGMKDNIHGEGHYHQSYMCLYRNVIAFLIPCLIAKTGFIKRQGLENTMGAYYVDLYLNKRGDIEYLEFEEKRFYDTDVKEHNYGTPRLVLK